jgi:hypothetical protein
MARDTEVANGGDEMHGQELFETAFDHFVAALRVLSHDAETQCDEMGSYNTPGEIQFDVVGSGLGILRISAEWLDWAKAEKLLDLVAGIRRLPSEALYVPHLSMTSREGCLVAMGHPAWAPLRSDAAMLLTLLAPEIERNERYLWLDDTGSSDGFVIGELPG